MAGKFQALAACQIQGCAEEVSYHLDMLALYKGQPICQGCYEEHEGHPAKDWNELPQITLNDLCA